MYVSFQLWSKASDSDDQFHLHALARKKLDSLDFLRPSWPENCYFHRGDKDSCQTGKSDSAKDNYADFDICSAPLQSSLASENFRDANLGEEEQKGDDYWGRRPLLYGVTQSFGA